MGSTMGMRMPKVPQLVPVAKAKPPPTRKMMAGSMLYRPAAAPSMQPETNSAAPSALVMLLSVSAKVRMMMAGTMASKPGTMDFIASLNEITRRRIRYTNANSSAMSEPHGRAVNASVLPNARMTFM